MRTKFKRPTVTGDGAYTVMEFVDTLIKRAAFGPRPGFGTCCSIRILCDGYPVKRRGTRNEYVANVLRVRIEQHAIYEVSCDPEVLAEADEVDAANPKHTFHPPELRELGCTQIILKERAGRELWCMNCPFEVVCADERETRYGKTDYRYYIVSLLDSDITRLNVLCRLYKIERSKPFLQVKHVRKGTPSKLKRVVT